MDTSDNPISFPDEASTLGDNGYGNYALTGGTWTYTLNNAHAAVQALDAGETLTDTHTFTATDGSTQIVTITINGTEDAPVIGGTSTGSVTEDGTLTANGTLTITDVDTSDNPISFPDEASTLGDNGYGNYALTGGTWTYTLNSAHAAVQALDAGETLTDTHTFTASDGSTQVVTITINGTEDAPVIGGTSTGSVTEDGTLTANGTLTITDVDTSDNPISFPDEASTLGDNGYGDYAISSGTWTYTLNNAHAAVQALDAGETLTDTHTFTASDGSTQVVTITISGTEDAPVIGGTSTGSVTEDGTLTANGTLTITDVDTSDNPISFPDEASTLGDNGYGNYALSSGTWTYTLNNAHAAVQALDAGETLTDTHTFTASDGSTQVVTITINGTEDAPVLDLDADNSSGQGGADYTATFTEDGGPVFVADADASLSDVDSATLRSLSVTIANLLDGAAEDLSAVTGGTSISASYDSGTGVLTLTGVDTVANYQQVLRTITYDNTLQDPDATARMITFVAFDGTDTSNVGTTTLTIVSQNDAPVVNDQSFGIIENSPNGTSVGTIAFSDPESGDSHTFTVLGGTGATAFSVNALTGKITVADSSQLDYESATSLTLQVQLTDDGTPNLSDTATITINLTDEDEFDVGPVTDVDPATNEIDESATGGETVNITASATDDDATTNGITYSLDDDAVGRFLIDGTSGVVSVAAGASFDTETEPTVNVTVRATSEDGSFNTETFTINVNDVDEFDIGPISDTDGAADEVAEDAAIGTAVGITANAADADATDDVSYSLDDDAGGRFQVDSTTGVITVKDQTLLDYEAQSSHNVTVRATSDDGSSSIETFTINLIDENDNAPAITPSQSFSAREDAPNSTSVGSVAATDVDTVGSLQGWAIIGGNTDGIFAIDSNTGEITIADNTNLDYETTPSHTLTLTVSDGVNTSAPETVTINVQNVNEAPVNHTPGAQVTSEDTPLTFSSAGGNAITVSDVDAGTNPVLVTLNAANGTLTLGSTTGLTFDTGDGVGDVTMTFAGTIDEINNALEGLRFDPTPDYNGPATIQITVDDQGNVGLDGAKTDLDTINVTITPVNDAPVASDGLFTVNEHSPAGTPVGTASASDVDAGDVLTYRIIGGSGNGVFGIDPATGEIIVVDPTQLVYETDPSFNLSIEVEDLVGAMDRV